MRVLALDTTARGGSAALVADDRIIAESAGDPARSHAEQLPALLLTLLERADLAPAAVDLFAVASGPGSFTGLRIGIATIQGLALVTRRRVAPISALDALAHQAARERTAGDLVGVWIDAYRGDVFSALYRVRNTGASPFEAARLEEIDPPAVGIPHLLWQTWVARHGTPAVLAGDGAHRYAPDGPAALAPVEALAGTIGRIAAHRAAGGATVDPAGVQPLYIRKPDAEVARDRVRAGAGALPPPREGA